MPSHHPSAPRTASQRSADPEYAGSPRPPSPPSKEEATIVPPTEEVTPLRLVAHYSILVFASIAGCLIRLGLTALGTYDGRSVFPILWSQGVGCAIMGTALARKNEIVGWYPPLQTFWTTGVAASITTFSTWMEEGYLAFSNFEGYNRGGLYDAVDGIVYTFATFAVALACLHFGEYFASILPALPKRKSNHKDVRHLEKHSSSSPTRKNDRHRMSQHPLLDILTIVSAILSYLLALILYFYTLHTWRHRAIFPILLSPPGTMLRFALSKLNGKPRFQDKFPLGTFLANMIATVVLAGVFAEQHRIGSGVRCNAMYAIQQGFCGCLSTVSTFAVEARNVRGWWKWIYIGGSIVMGHLLMLAVFGGVGWAKGYGPVCTE